MTTVQFEAFRRVSLSGSMPHRARAAGHQLGFRINPFCTICRYAFLVVTDEQMGATYRRRSSAPA